MKVLETLHLRLAGDDLDDLVELVRGALGTPGSSPRVAIYRHSRVQGDLLIHLRWEGPEQSDDPSEIGLRLAALLRFQGLVEHSVWVQGEGWQAEKRED